MPGGVGSGFVVEDVLTEGFQSGGYGISETRQGEDVLDAGEQAVVVVGGVRGRSGLGEGGEYEGTDSSAGFIKQSRPDLRRGSAGRGTQRIFHVGHAPAGGP
jgi:hypothetical protein